MMIPFRFNLDDPTDLLGVVIFLARFEQKAQEAGWTRDEIARVTKEATSGPDCEHLAAVTRNYTRRP
jgi:hypothetical protein